MDLLNKIVRSKERSKYKLNVMMAKIVMLGSEVDRLHMIIKKQKLEYLVMVEQ